MQCAESTPQGDLSAHTDVAGAVTLFAALAHPVRLTALLALARQGSRTVGELMALTDSEQSAMSHQLRVLRDARLVVAERVGRQVRYDLHDAHVAHIVQDALVHAAEASTKGAAAV